MNFHYSSLKKALWKRWLFRKSIYDEDRSPSHEQ